MRWRIAVEKDRIASEGKRTPLYGARIYVDGSKHVVLKAGNLHASLTAARDAMADLFGELEWKDTPSGAEARLEAFCNVTVEAR